MLIALAVRILAQSFQITGAFPAQDDLRLSFGSETDKYYQVWATDSLTGDWTLVRGMTLGTNDVQEWTDHDVISTFDRLYYRLLRVPLTQPRDQDSDGLDDAYELQHPPLDPLNPDTDHDGLKDGQESTTCGTDPLNPDTDGDGFNDGTEAVCETDPLAALSTPDFSVRILAPADKDLITTNFFTIRGLAPGSGEVMVNGKVVPVSVDGKFAAPVLVAPGTAHKKGITDNDPNYIVMSFPGPTVISASAQGASDEVEVFCYQLGVKCSQSFEIVDRYEGPRIEKWWNDELLTIPPFSSWSCGDSNSWLSHNFCLDIFPRCHTLSSYGGAFGGTVSDWPWMPNGFYIFGNYCWTGSNIAFRETYEATIRGLPARTSHPETMLLLFKDCTFLETDYHFQSPPPLDVGTYLVNGEQLHAVSTNAAGEITCFAALTNYPPDADLDLDIQPRGYSPPIQGIWHDYIGVNEGLCSKLFSFRSLSLLDMRLFRDKALTKPLDDWPAETGKLRSPKYIFGKKDSIYIRVKGPAWLGSNLSVRVTSESDTDGVEIDLVETNGTYVNDAQRGLLRLGDATVAGPTNFIKVVEEDVLTFKLKVRGCETGYNPDVMVDRGEHAECGISVFFGDAAAFNGEMDANRVHWWNVGYAQYSDQCASPSDQDYGKMPSFIRSSGTNKANSVESDFFLYTCHGDNGGNGVLLDNSGNPIMYPSNMANSSDWNNDVEWVWADACSTLSTNGTGRDGWDDALFGTDRPAHMILGYWQGVGTDIADEIQSFFDYATNMTIVEAYFHANTEGSFNEPCAIVAHGENASDKLKEVTRDTSSTALRYYWYEQDNWNQESYAKTLRVRGVDVCLSHALPSNYPSSLAPLVLRQRSIFRKPAHFQQRSRPNGVTVLLRTTADLALRSQPQDPAVLADTALTAALGRIPQDAVVSVTGVLYSVDYQRGSPFPPPRVLYRVPQHIHTIDGIPVLGDFLTATVSSSHVAKLAICWHDLRARKRAETAPVSDAISALGVAVLRINPTITKTREQPQVHLRNAQLVYAALSRTTDPEITYSPAWLFEFVIRGRIYRVVVDALNNSHSIIM